MSKIIKMALQAGMRFSTTGSPTVAIELVSGHVRELEKFAELVAAAERERCAQECYDISIDNYQTALGSNSGMYDHRANGAEECDAAIHYYSFNYLILLYYFMITMSDNQPQTRSNTRGIISGRHRIGHSEFVRSVGFEPTMISSVCNTSRPVS